MSTAEPAPRSCLPFEYWSDPLCIWAFVSEQRLQRLLTDKGSCLDVQHRVVVVFGSVPWRFREGPWQQPGPAGRAEATRRIAERFGRDDVDGRVWLDDPPASSWSPGAAIKAAFAAEQAQELAPGTANRFQSALREAFFVDNRNIARHRVQLEVAEATGLDTAALERCLEDGRALALLWEDQRLKEEQKIQGSPTYVFDGGRAQLYGNFAEGILRATVQELLEGMAPGSSHC
jgi:predicted DsbA family dithiol-disulfide isomerase